MEKLYSHIRGIKLPSKNEIRAAINSFSLWQRAAFVLVFIIFAVSAITLLFKTNNAFLVATPTYGGTLREGLIGTPRFINPVLALSDSDRDLSALIYSGLMRKSAQGELVPDLAEKYEISKDGLVYTFTLRDGLEFHDREPVTADDVVFTVNKVKDTLIKSPKKLHWEGVTAERVDERTVKFTLKQPFAAFLENATLGILPAHLWKEISTDQFSFIELNVKPVGTGPYKVGKVKKKSSGIPTEYDLLAFNRFALGKPYIKNFIIRFYENESALIAAMRNGEIEQIAALSPAEALPLAEKGYRLETAVLPRIFGLFFNQNQQKIFTDKKIIKAFELAIDKDRIIEEVLYGYGIAIDGPIPQNMLDYSGVENLGASLPREAKLPSSHLDEAKKILADDGWVAGEDGVLEKTLKNKAGKKETLRLQFAISTGDQPELKTAVELIKKDLEALGAKIEIKVFEIGSLNQDVIRPRKYEALFFGQIISHDGDLFAFWHSSQRNDPGLNIAMYTNAKVDKILESALDTLDKKERLKKYTEFEAEIKRDRPVIFVYSPKFIYATSRNLKGLALGQIDNSPDRFSQVNEWHREEDKVWKIFTNN